MPGHTQFCMVPRIPDPNYGAKFADAVYVVHCFQKTTQKTRKTDLDLAGERYRELMKERASE